MTSCILFQRINAVPYLYFPTFNHGEIQCLLYCVKKKKKKDRRDMDRWTEEGNACQMSMGKWTMRDSERMKLADTLGPRSLHGHDMPVKTGWNVVVWLMDSSRGSGVESVNLPGVRNKEKRQKKKTSESFRAKNKNSWSVMTQNKESLWLLLTVMCQSDTQN